MKALKYSIKGESDLGGCYLDEHQIKINLSRINCSIDDYDTDFYTLLMHVINHEFLHYLIYITEDKSASTDLDNLTHGKQRDDNIWEYWLA